MIDPAERDWVDQPHYFGPNRRSGGFALRVRDRRRQDLSQVSPSLDVALRKLRMRVMDAHGQRGVCGFADRVVSVALLADRCGAEEVSERLADLAHLLYARDRDELRPRIYRALDAMFVASSALH